MCPLKKDFRAALIPPRLLPYCVSQFPDSSERDDHYITMNKNKKNRGTSSPLLRGVEGEKICSCASFKKEQEIPSVDTRAGAYHRRLLYPP